MVRILFEASVIGFAQAEVLARTGIYSLSSQLLRALHDRPDVDLSLAYAPRWHEPLAGYLAASGMVDLIGKPPYAGDEPLHVFTPYYGVELGELPNPVIHDWLVICDLLPVLHPELFPCSYEAAFRKNTLQFIRPETQVVCISECTRRDFLSLYPGTAARTHVLYPAVADRFHRPVAAAEVARVRRATGIPEGQPYILSVGTLEPRKNLEAVVDAFAAFVAAGGAPTSLVLTGASGWGNEQLQRQIAAVPGLREKVIVTGYVPDDDLPALYAGALCFLYLSYYEGYGLPPMEAFACGCPAVVSDRASLPEVAGEVGILTDPNDIAGVARLIGDFRDGRIDRAALGERSRRHAAPSTWATVAETLVAAMRRLESPAVARPPRAAATSSPPCRVCGGRTEERFARSAEGGRPARAVHQCVVCGSLTLTGDFSARRTLPPGFAGQAEALADRADAALFLVGAPRTEPLLVEGMDDGLLAALLCERGYAACRPRDATVSSHAGVPNLAGDFAEAVLWSRFEAEADPAEALARAVALHPDAIVVDCPLWSGPQSAAILDDLGDETRFLPTMPGLQRLAERIGYRLHSSGRIHVLVLDPPRKLKAQTVADMHWKLTNDSYFPQLIDSLRRRRREQADIRLRRILGPAAPFRGVGAAPRRALSAKKRPFVIEGSFFHLSTQSGIARVWKNIFAEWRKDGFLDRVVLLDRGGTAPRFEGVEILTVEPHHYDRLDVDPGLMQAYCDDLDAAAFCSTYYARPVSTPTLAAIYDMIPEVLGFDLTTPMWVEKHDLIRRADRFVCISERTRRDLLRFFPEATLRPVEVAHPAVDPAFLAPLPENPGAVLKKHGIDRDYVVYLGGQGGYKGADVLVAALASLPEAERPLVIFVGDGTVRQEDVERLGYDGVYGMQADDEELRCLLAHAFALVNPSHYEGFGLTVLEAFACGCPVICSDGGSLPEVAGDAALIFPVGNVVKLAEAIRQLSDLRVSSRLVMRGQKRLAEFSWSELAGAVRAALEELAEGRRKPTAAGPRVLLALHPPEGRNGQFGGPTRRVLATARALDRIGVRAEVVSGNHMPDGDFDVVHVHNIWSPEEALAQVEYFRPRCHRLVFSPIYLDQSEFAIAFGLTKMFAEAASLDDAAALYAPMMEHLRRINPDIDGNLRMLDPEYRARLRRILDTVDHVVFLSEYEKAAMTALEPLGDCGHSIVRNAAGTDWLEGADPDAFRRAAGLSDYVLCVGNLERRKNQLSLAVAWKDEPQPLVLIGGGGDEPYAEQVRRCLRPGWLATGRLDNDALLASAYAGAAAFVLPSLAEGAPLSALEAAAAGTPPALSDRSSEREYFGGFATYFDPTDPPAINAAVKEAMERGRDPAYRAALKDFARKRYSYDRLAASLRDLYAALALPTGRG